LQCFRNVFDGSFDGITSLTEIANSSAPNLGVVTCDILARVVNPAFVGENSARKDGPAPARIITSLPQISH
jgi:hypothetical protein